MCDVKDTFEKVQLHFHPGKCDDNDDDDDDNNNICTRLNWVFIKIKTYLNTMHAASGLTLSPRVHTYKSNIKEYRFDAYIVTQDRYARTAYAWHALVKTNIHAHYNVIYVHTARCRQ